MSGPLILGHRGASAVAPENTLAAFTRAIEDGADGIEFDVRLSADHVPVVIHDDSLKRTAGKDALVSSLTAAELMKCDVGSWFKSKYADQSFDDERLPSLQQVFDLFQTLDGILYVEMKCAERDGVVLAQHVVNLIRENRMIDRVVVESFDLSAIASIKDFDSVVRTAALFEPKLSQPLSTLRRQRMIELAQQHRADEIAFHYSIATPRLVEKAIQKGFEVVLWTVDDPAWIERARTRGIKALISNNPGDMLKHKRNKRATD